ncbi:MAG TPA: hypothetical protein VG796_09750 [Verrucomicrobiales bacterium]|jgi:hypothetical protein|nr:hypothetical protein [Verrucomicrobiales bacterium]
MNFKKSLTPAELEAILTPQLRLFLSVDVVGSTAFKHRKALEGESKPWLKFIHGFYTGFPEICWRRVGEVQAGDGPGTQLVKPYLWKALGDELIFSVPLRHPSYTRLYLKAFRLSLIEAIKHWAGGERPLPISFKGAAWLAGFPVFNSAVPLDVDKPLSAESEHFDFVGPLIDIGFRLSRFASPRKFVISADIAWLITTQGDTAAMKFYYEGRESLKGVLNDRPYPIFWIDCYEDNNDGNMLDFVEDKVINRAAVAPENVRDLASAFLDSVGSSIPKPFFHGDGIPPKFQPPPSFAAGLANAQDEIKKIYEISYQEVENSRNPQEVEGEVTALLENVRKTKPLKIKAPRSSKANRLTQKENATGVIDKEGIPPRRR